jgi:hypothetical protein
MAVCYYVLMSEKIQTNQPVELQLLTPELGVFIVTGILQDVEPVMHDFRGRSVSQSTFEVNYLYKTNNRECEIPGYLQR